MRNTKHFVGRKIRGLREDNSLSQSAFAEQLGISTSYLNQIENNQRPITATVLFALAENFNADITEFSTNDGDRIVADLREALSDPVFSGERVSLQDLKLVAKNAPELAHALLSIHRAYRGSTDRLAQLDASMDSGNATVEPTPYEEVRDFFHYIDNYVDVLDRMGEECAASLSDYGDSTKTSLSQYLLKRHKIHVAKHATGSDTFSTIRAYDHVKSTITLSSITPDSTDSFQLAHQIGLIEADDIMDRIIVDAGFRTASAGEICKIGLANYFAGAVILPYTAFAEAAERVRHDLETLSQMFSASIEQIAHRLSTLQKPGQKGVPFFFVRVDQAGNITKRHSATKLQFARFGASCPIWNVHSAFESESTFVRQLAETPDGAQYISIARQITKPGGAFDRMTRRYAIALGCEIKHAAKLIYADDLNVTSDKAFSPIGISCRICERADCIQRAVPPISKQIRINHSDRKIVPYSM